MTINIAHFHIVVPFRCGRSKMVASVASWCQPAPIPRNSLIGRQAEIALGHALLLDEAVALLTLTGPGGVGKTRLALAIAREAAGRFADGVAWADLAPIIDPSLVPATVANAVGLVLASGAAVEHELTRHLRPRQTLLLLDNCEHLLPATADLVSHLLAACPALQVLASSRAPLHLRGEQELPVEPLPLPSSPASPPDTLLASDAVRLFVERARLVRPGFSLNETQAVTVAEICRRLDGLPLAIELAAARCKIFPAEMLLAQMTERLQWLSDGPRDLPARQRTIRDTISWSYDLLDPEGQRLFRLLAIFVGGFTLDAAQAVGANADGSGRNVTSTVVALVDQGLVRRTGTEDAPRFMMLETIREFGRERLADSGEMEAARVAHAAWCLALAEEAEPHLGGPEQGVWLARLETDHDNLRAALTWWREQGDAGHGLRLATALLRFWDTRDYMTEGRPHLMAFLALPGEDVSLQARARGLDAASELASWEAQHATAARLAAEALVIQRQLANPAGVARALYLLGSNALGLGDVEQAQSCIDEGLAIARGAADHEGEALHLRVSGTIHSYRRESALAIPFFEASLALWRALGARDEICSDLGELALAVGHLGDRARAISLWEQVLPLAHEIGEEWMIAMYLEGHAELALLADRPDLAARLLGAADNWRSMHGAPVLGFAPSISGAFSTARDRLGAEAYQAALAAGRALSLDDAVREAQSSGETDPAASQPSSRDRAASLGLTRREREILALLCARMTDLEIAERLFLSSRTVEGHVSHLLGKLGADNRRDAAAAAVRLGLA
jgi:predicted ATPase/DNA-binding NarL/FixJ family response regulator